MYDTSAALPVTADDGTTIGFLYPVNDEYFSHSTPAEFLSDHRPIGRMPRLSYEELNTLYNPGFHLITRCRSVANLAL